MQIPKKFELIERPNKAKLAKHINNPLIYATDRVRLFRYYTAIEENQITIKYSRKKFNGVRYGRYFPKEGTKLSATYQWRKIRATAFADTCNDIDIQNCHPVLLDQLFSKITLMDAQNLQYYITNRDQIINDFIINQEAIKRYNLAKQDCATKKDFVKGLFTIVLYGGTLKTFEETFGLTEADYKLPKFFVEFQEEMKLVSKDIINCEEPYIAKLVADYKIEHGNNIRANALLALILQDLEAQIITIAMNEFRQLSDSEIIAYAYDGFMATKHAKIDAICHKLSAKVHAKTGYSVVFLNKPFEEPLADPLPTMPVILQRNNKLTIDKFKHVDVGKMDEFLMATCAYVSGTGDNCWMFRKNSTETSYVRIKPEHLKSALISCKKELPPKKKKKKRGRPKKNIWDLATYLTSISGMWDFERVEFVPYLEWNGDLTSFNLFDGFRHEYDKNAKVSLEKIEPILHHIWNIWCNKNYETFDYVLNWLAGIIQHPTEKNGTALLLKSTKQGAGKNIICDFIASKVIGKKYTDVLSNSEELFDKFNAIAENRLLVIVDEIADNGAYHKLSDRVKSLITQIDIHIENKGVDKRTVKDYANYILLTNNNLPVKIEGSDRRYLALEVSNEHANDVEYFSNLVSYLTDEVGWHFFHFLANRDISKFKPSIIPQTELKTELKLNNAPIVVQFLYRLAIGEIDTRYIEGGQIECGTSQLFNCFMEWAAASNIQHRINLITFGRDVGKIMQAQLIYLPAGRMRGYKISLKELKNKVVEYVGIQI